MEDDEIEKKLIDILESDDCPSYAKVMSLAIMQTRKDLHYLKKLNQWQIALIVSLLTTVIAGLLSTI